MIKIDQNTWVDPEAVEAVRTNKSGSVHAAEVWMISGRSFSVTITEDNATEIDYIVNRFEPDAPSFEVQASGFLDELDDAIDSARATIEG